jgi:hypothetical protein
MLRYLLPSVGIVAACMAVYATSLRAPPAKVQWTVAPVVFMAPPAPAQPEVVKPVPLRAQNLPPLFRPVIPQTPLGGHRRPNWPYSAGFPNPGPPSIHELPQY